MGPSVGVDTFGYKPKRTPRDTDAARHVDILTQYDLLGPLCRAVIADSPIDVHIGLMLGEAPISCMDNWGGWDDAKLARWITGVIEAKVKMRRDSFMLVPRCVMNRR